MEDGTTRQSSVHGGFRTRLERERERKRWGCSQGGGGEGRWRGVRI
jgi:hypothetical protein